MPLDKESINKKRSENIKMGKREAKYSGDLEFPKYTFENIVLTPKQISDINTAISYDVHKDLLMKEWGLESLYPEKKGLLINLYGESGTGKTMVAHAIAHKLSKRIIVVNYAEIESKYVGETSKNLLEVFRKAEENEAVLLFDEADALLSKRVTNMNSSTDVSVNQTKSVLLNILNDYSSVVIFTTNFISNYDYAFIRRIPFQIKFELPDLDQRKHIWKYYLSTGIPYDFNIDDIAQKFDNISGSDISNAMWLSALEAAETGINKITEGIISGNLKRIVDTKRDNRSVQTKVTVRDVDEEYVKQQLANK